MTETQAITIRPLASSDRAEWQRMWKGYLGFYRTRLDAEMLALAFERLLADRYGEFSGLLAEADGRPAGLAHYLFHRHGWRREKVCYLQDLWVEPGFRGRGIGRHLIEAVYGCADADGSPAVWWLTAEDNHQARRLYDRVGRKSPFIRYDRP